MTTYYTKQDPQTGMDLKKSIECFPAVITDDGLYNCEMCLATDCKHYCDIVLVEEVA